MAGRRGLGFCATGLALIAVMLAGLAGCRLGGRQAAAVDDRLRPVAAKSDFRDLKGSPVESIVDAYVRLGVIELASGTFDPEGPVSRGEFATWLVRANDIYFRDQARRQVPLASFEDRPSFVDVQPSVGCFSYVQGLVNAGHKVTWGASGDFGYDHTLTRERLILLRNGVDLGKDSVLADPAAYNELRVRLRPFLKDADQVADECLAAVMADVTKGDTIKLAFGGTDRLAPKRIVSRQEAVLALTKLGGRTYDEALALEPKPAPLTADELKALAEEQQSHGHTH
jgi:S-layer homology domain